MVEGGRASEVLQREVARRRSFAITSHPDAGKTSLTEKLLLYSGAVHLAGAVRARKSQRYVTSDWMALERERGISITTTALQFEHRGYILNLLDTPGHQDFSEDTYRTLMAVDSAVMVLDSAKGIESQTRKLFEVCRLRHLPILTFINKLDAGGREPFDLLDEIERVLGIGAVPVDWPIGGGATFQGVYHLHRRCVLEFHRVEHNLRPAPLDVTGLGDPRIESRLGRAAARALREEIELLRGAGARFERNRFHAGNVTPVFFGSALNSFGVEPFFDALIDLAPPPGTRPSDTGPVDPAHDAFSGFIFKIMSGPSGAQHEPILAAVGELQFDVVQARLREEYGVETALKRLPYTCARWIDAPPELAATMNWPHLGSLRAMDGQGRVVGLFVSSRELAYCQETNPGVSFAQLG